MEFLSYLISGISLGSVYAIIALGYTMVYGIAKMLNFAHGDIIMVGGYISFCAMNYLGLPSIVGIILAILVCTVLGVVIEGLAYKPLRAAPSLAVLITAIGVSYFLQNAALLHLVRRSQGPTPPSCSGSLSLFGGAAEDPLCLHFDRGGVPRDHGGPHCLHQHEQNGQGHAGLLRG